jgi:hypothetical protein
MQKNPARTEVPSGGRSEPVLQKSFAIAYCVIKAILLFFCLDAKEPKNQEL